jgi:hypothetical protein
MSAIERAIQEDGCCLLKNDNNWITWLEDSQEWAVLHKDQYGHIRIVHQVEQIEIALKYLLQGEENDS